jgi:predicted DNA binding CopG/RHH family protein
MKLSKEEKEIEALYDRGAFELRKPDKALLKQLKTAAENTFKKDKRINIRLSDHDMVGIQRVAASRGVPYQSLISGLIHQFIEGDLTEKTKTG